ncbi:hypothetical protein DNTS_014281 [Danionella cerebrum]|uniref:Calponin-homology (CH) domain-containing protein n=1 Tax=Danionella cerebrum TaxID=2873325 RepID=A0A553R437_9TELE|nr:hypothetical protein DNTS_014281 [Danionella translucida]
MSFNVAKAECLDFSPTFSSQCSRDENAKENIDNIPVLSLVQFSKSPFVSFGTIKLGSSKSFPLRIDNPTENATVTVIVEKISASKGFSVDQMCFTIQPEGSKILMVTWTPVAEGGVRELLCFIANGLIKHQAILLGKAESTKKKKKTLWDTIKSKKGVSTPSREKKGGLMPARAPNKTFHVSRQSQYKRHRISNPLLPLNQQESTNVSSPARLNTGSFTPEMSKQAFITETFDDSHLQKNSPVVVLVPAERLFSTPGKKDEPCSQKEECRDVTMVLNKTLSPINTKEKFVNPPASCLQSPIPVIGKMVRVKIREPEKASLSLKDALGLIGSDLSLTASPPNACSSFDFSDSLESDKMDPVASFRASGIISPPSESADPRLTFCVKPSKVVNFAPNEDVLRPKPVPFSTATVTKSNKLDGIHLPGAHKNCPVNSTTGITSKIKASIEIPGLRKKKATRRRLLEKTLELSEPSNAESNTSTPESISALPIINSDSSPELATESKFPVKEKKVLISSPHEGLLPSLSSIDQVFPSVNICPASIVSEKVVPGHFHDQFPVQSRTFLQSKKRKSDEFLRSNNLRDQSNVQAKKSRALSKVLDDPTQDRMYPSRSTSVSQQKTNMFYDERWIEKQERGFTWWMNYILTPDDFKVATEVTKVNALSLTIGNDKFNVPKAPTKEEMSFRTYTARQRLNRLRRAACKLFSSETMVKAIQRLELEVEAKRLLVRKDRHLWKDIGERQKILNWLIAYNPLWLRIGLETIYGELISLESNNDVMGLAMFILGRLLWNPDIAAEFRHHKVPNLYKDGHEEALSRFTLKKLILLVCFLDKAKESRLIEHDPCLFCMDAEFKSSKDLLLAFSRDFLSGEGILSRHLSYLGLAVSHVQTPLDEFSFAVKKLAVDLKCGIRLVRVMELFTLDWTLSKKLRIPAISRLQKVHNVDVALQVLKNKGVDLRDDHGTIIDSRDIVDGHREKTLSLLWKIIFAFQVEVLLNEDQLKEEIGFLRKSWRTKQKLASILANKGLAVMRMKAGLAFEHPSPKVTLLMDWVNAVCEFYNLKAENFTVSFSDGRILCYLIHHYHPGHLAAENIKQRTTQTIECGHRGRVELNTSSSDSDCSFENTSQTNSVSVDFRELLENERSNFQLVNTAVSYLGGVPAMINPEDMSNTIPNEKVVTCYLSFLCTRLLDLRNETRAARQKNKAATKIQALVRRFIARGRLIRQNEAAIVIQVSWRGYSSREKLKVLKKKKHYALQNKAATLIQKTFKSWMVKNLLKKSLAACVIQTAFRKWHAKKMLERNTAAVQIQSWYRMLRCKRQYLDMRRKAVCVQAWFKGHLQRSKFHTLKKRHQASIVVQSAFRAHLVRKRISTMHQNAILIQRCFRAHKQRKADQRRYVEIKSAALVLQAAFRGWKTRRSVAQHNRAALVIQTTFRRFLVQRNFLSLKRSAIVLQKRYRAKAQGGKVRREFLALKSASVAIQAIWRGRAERKLITQLHACARIIQSNYRRHVVLARFLQMKQAAVVIQKRFRAFRNGQKVYVKFTEMKKAAVVLQSAYRGWRTRRHVQRKMKAATLIQSVVRAHLCRRRFLAQKRAAVVIQQWHRASTLGLLERTHYTCLRQATIKLQAVYRGYKARQHLRREHQAATVIQSQFRMYKVRIDFVDAKRAALVIQQRYKAYKVGKSVQASYLKKKNAALVIQSAFRGMKVRNYMQKSHQAATLIQAHFRGLSQLRKFRRQRCAALVLQQRLRAMIAKNAVRKEYLTMKTAATYIQATFRGARVRKQMREKHKFAKVIQLVYRTFKQRQKYLTLRRASICIQQRYRAIVSARKHHQRYCSLKAAAITLQSTYRGLKVRKEIEKHRQAATVIQAIYRMHRARVPYQEMKLASLVIQRKFRSHLLRREARGNFLKLKKSTIAIQAIYRGNTARRNITRMHCAANVIQRQYLTHKQRTYFLSLRAAVCFCQQQYRSVLIARNNRNNYIAKRRAVVAIQAGFKGMMVRQQIKKEHQAAIIIQSHVRKHIFKSRFQQLRHATCSIQKRFRAIKLMRQEMALLQEKKNAALILQAAFRGMRSRQCLKQMHKSATVVQTSFRAYSARKRYLAMKYAAIAIQQRLRAVNIGKEQRNQFMEMRRSAVLLQASYRGLQVRRKLQLRHQSAVLIQSCFRRYEKVVKFQAMRLSAIIIQRKYRSYIQARAVRENYLLLKKSAIVLQAAFRGRSLRTRLAKRQEASMIIQASFRMFQQRSAFKKLRRAAIVLQQRYRAQKLRDEQMRQFKLARNAAVCLQKHFRGMKGRELAMRTRAARTIQSFLRMSVQRQQFLKERSGAIVLQSAYRGHLARVQYTRMQASTVLIQKWYRSLKLVQKHRNQFVDVKQATLTLQSALRRMLARRLARRTRAAIKIQSVMRMHPHRKRYTDLRCSVLKLQAHYRMKVAHQRYRQVQTATSTLQKYYRAHRARVEQRAIYLQTLQKIKMLQARVRGWIAYRRFQRLKSSSITIQAHFRGLIERRRFQQLKGSALVIQEYYQAVLLCKKERAKFLQLRQSALLIQSWYRGCIARRSYILKRAAIATIRRCIRTKRHRSRFQAVQRSVRVIQKRWKETLISRKQHTDFLRCRKSAVNIQALWRGQRVRDSILKQKTAAVKIQSAFRGFSQRRRYHQQRSAAITLQRHFRDVQLRRAEEENRRRRHNAAVYIQALWRGWLARQQFEAMASAARCLRFTAASYHHLCAVKIQRTVRAHWALKSAKRKISSVLYIQQCFRAKLQRKRYLKDRADIIRVQRTVKIWLHHRNQAASVIQAAALKYLHRCRKERLQCGIVKVQRLKEVNRRVKEEDKLCNKTTTALSYLLGLQNYAFILAALKHLETATRLSPECCERLVESGATHTIFTLIRSCNRSVPSMEIISISIQILLNLSKFNRTIDAVYEVECSLETLLDLLQIYREKAGDKVAEKGGSIFTKACFLLVLLVQDEKRAMEIRSLPKVSDRIRSIYRLALRKYNMDAERNKAKQRLNTSINGLIQATPRKSKPVARFAPDWVLRRDKMKDIVDPLHAIQMLANALKLLS